MAILDWGADQHRVHLAVITQLAPGAILERGEEGKLHLARAGCGGLFCRRVDPGVAMALSARSD